MIATPKSRLTAIVTSWTLVGRAHTTDDTLASSARNRLLDQYSDAVWRYLRAAAKDDQVAEDLFQEFVVRMLRGDFCRANPAKGRFRDYLKTVIVNLVNDHFRHCSRTVQLHNELPARSDTTDQNEHAFDRCWREQLLCRAWQRLEQHRMMFTVLRSHVSNVNATASEKAAEIQKQLGTTWNSNRFRVCLHRAREKFARILEDEVADTLQCDDEKQLCDELRQLRLLKYCRRVESSRQK